MYDKWHWEGIMNILSQYNIGFRPTCGNFKHILFNFNIDCSLHDTVFFLLNIVFASRSYGIMSAISVDIWAPSQYKGRLYRYRDFL